tara:strand:+ start:232 stop:561 length:330 start_codon:yes stop_codon:yes gene_type:complete
MSEKWIPEIVYEEGEGNIPFIMVPNDEEMPKILFIFESRETGDFEPGLEGEEVPVIQWDLCQYGNMVTLKNNLDPVTYDIVRSALGLEPLLEAAKKGSKITESVKNNIT